MKQYFYNQLSKDVVPIRHFLIDESNKKALPLPSVLVIEWDGKRAFLYRYLDEETPCGDTWHRSLEDAFDQVNVEYPSLLKINQWLIVPEGKSHSILEAIGYIFGSNFSHK